MVKPEKISVRFLALGFLLIMSGCVVTPGSYSPPRYYEPAFVYWYYYPNYGVYYQPTEHYYYYSVGGVWRRSSTLPRGWVLTDEPRVQLKASGNPYEHHSDHRRQYPPRRTVVMPGGQRVIEDRYDNGRRPNRDDRHDNGRRPDYDDRHPGNSNNHRPDRDSKDERNIFKPHLKGESNYDKNRGYDERKQGYQGPGKPESGNVLKNLKKGPYEKEQPAKNVKSKPEKRKGKDSDRKNSDRNKGKGSNKGDYKKDSDSEQDDQSGEKPAKDLGGKFKGLN